MDTKKFMALYAKFINHEGDPFEDEFLCNELHRMLLLLDDPREIKNPENPDREHYGYVCVEHSFIINLHGHIVGTVLKGDVLILQLDWDRNIIITHSPITKNTPIPYLLKDTKNFTGLRGIWLPIFDPEYVIRFAKMRNEKNRKALFQLLEEEQKYWK
jgi:hypothetical protein